MQRPDIAVIGTGQTVLRPKAPDFAGPELVYQAMVEALDNAGLRRDEVDVLLSGSADLLDGNAFQFYIALNSMGSWPAIHESHVEMDAAWAAYYAWLRLLSGQFETAVVVGWSKASEAQLDKFMNLQLDPFYTAPLGVDHVSTAALQASLMLSDGELSARALDTVIARSRQDVDRNPKAEPVPLDLNDPTPAASPLLARHCAPVADAACAVVLARRDVAERVCRRPAWIAHAGHRVEAGGMGVRRDLAALPAAAKEYARLRERAGWGADSPDLVELSTCFAHEEPLLVREMGLRESEHCAINPSGGPFGGMPTMVTGLIRLSEAARQVMGEAGGTQVPQASRAVAHASSGHALQHNLFFLVQS